MQPLMPLNRDSSSEASLTDERVSVDSLMATAKAVEKACRQKKDHTKSTSIYAFALQSQTLPEGLVTCTPCQQPTFASLPWRMACMWRGTVRRACGMQLHQLAQQERAENLIGSCQDGVQQVAIGLSLTSFMRKT